MRSAKNILVVDDEEDLRTSVGRLLAGKGYRVCFAADGEEAIEKFGGEVPIDLVILDVLMPKRNGYEVLLYVRKRKGHPHIPILMLTAKTEAEDVIDGFVQGADFYLAKPFDPSLLLKVVDYFLGESRGELQERLLAELWQAEGILYRLGPA